jgi:streptogrisin C
MTFTDHIGIRNRNARRAATRVTLLLALSAAIAACVPEDVEPEGDVEEAGANPPALDHPAVTSLAAEQGISVSEAQARLAWQASAVPLSTELETMLGPDFGGVWIDQKDGGRIKVGVESARFAAEASTLRAVATQRGVDAVTDVVPVRHSYAALYDASEELGEVVNEANRGAPAAITTGLDTSRNAVVLTLPQGQTLTGAQEAFVAEAQRVHGDAVVLEVGTGYLGKPQVCRVERDYGLACDAPLRGGVTLAFGAPGSATPWCTAGFIVRSKSDQKPYILTAGHCGNRIWSTHLGNGDRRDIGQTHSLRDNSEGDFQIISIANPAAWQLRAWVYVSSSPDTTVDPDYFIASDGSSLVGMRVCKTGKGTLSDCGTVLALNSTAPWGLRHAAKTNYCARGGDSGGPVYSDHVARGIHIGGVEGCGDHWYQGVQAAEETLNVNIAHGR